MPSMVLASSNAGKVKEFAQMLSPLGWTLLGLKDIGFVADIPETGATFEANALLKAQAVAAATSLPVLSDDSGLEVEALGGAPGVYTARFAGEGATNAQNRAKLLQELTRVGAKDLSQRRAQFVCVLCWLIPGEKPRYYTGYCRGTVDVEERGEEGFGYDPLFIPEGQNQTFAQLPADFKHALSHRGLAVQSWLNDRNRL